MAFDNTLMSKLNMSLTEGKVGVFWVYGPSTDNLATITASAYFNDWVNQVSKNDLIYIVGSDATDIREFTNTSGTAPVTVASFITAGDLADNSVTTAKIADSNVTEVKLAPNSMTGTIAANIADANVIGGIPLLFSIDTAGGATANVDVVMTHKIKVVDVWVVNNALGTTSDTILVTNQTATTDITNTMDIDKADTIITRSGEIDDAGATLGATDTLRVVETDGGGSDSPATTVYILAHRVA